MSLKTEIVNLVATATIGENVSLDVLTKFPFVTYDPSRHFCAYFKDETMEAKVSIFKSGKMIAAGAKSESAAKHDLHHVIKVLSKHGVVGSSKPKITIQNIVITVDLNVPLNLEEMQDLIPGLVYEPEQFPGAIFRPLSNGITALIFASGKMVVAGLKSEAAISNIVKSTLEEMNLP